MRMFRSPESRAGGVFRSPVFWGVVATVAVGAGVAFHNRRRFLRGSIGRGSAGPTPKLIARNPARIPTPTEVRRVGDRVLTRYEAKNITIDERLKLIQARVWDGVNDPRIRQLALQLTKGCGRDDGPCEAERIFHAVKQRVRYTGDVGPVKNPKTGVVEGIDYYQNPWVTWEYQGGDCDDADGLIAALLAVIGHTVRMRVSAPSVIGDWEHIYPVTLLPKDRPTKAVAVDITLPWSNARLGSEARYGKARDYYAIEAPA